MEETENRYERQERIQGWDQEKLTKTNIAIVGAGHIGNYLAASLGALGVGNLKIYDDETIDHSLLGKKHQDREFLLSRKRYNLSKSEALEEKISKINPLINIAGLHFEIDRINEFLLGKPDYLIVAKNDKSTIKKYHSYAIEKGINIYVVEGDENSALFRKVNSDSKNLKNYTGKEQDPITSEVISGLLVGEIANEIMGKNIKESLAYSPTGCKGDKFKIGRKKINPGDLSRKKALVIGAGALGNFLGLGLSHSGLRNIYLVDDDIIETTNLNRQILFYDKVGEYKTEVLAQRLHEINPNMNIEPIKRRVKEDFESELNKIGPDIIIDCVDNLSTRAILNHLAIKNKIPLISGGTDFQKGQVVVYRPGKSACLECRLGVDKALVRARTNSSCIYSPNPSVVITNHIIGSLMASETRCVLDPESYGEAIMKMIKYDSTRPVRIGLIGSDKSCKCKRKIKASAWTKRLMAEAA